MERGEPGLFRGQQKKIVKIGITLAALAGLFWLLDHIGWRLIGQNISNLGAAGAVTLIALGFVESMFDAISLCAATRERLGLLRILSFNQAGSLVNLFIPWEAGEVVKGRLLSNHISTKAAISGTIVWNYVFTLSKPAAALTASAFGWWFATAAQRPLTLMIAGAALASFLPYFAMRLVLRFSPAGLVIRLAAKLRILGCRDSKMLLESARDIDRTVRNFWQDSPSTYFRVFLYQYSARITAWFTYYAALLYLEPQSSFTLGFCGAIYAGLSVMTYLVLVLPTRIGTTEATGYVLFYFLGLNPPLGLITQLVMRLKAIACMLLPAAFVLFDRKKSPARAGQARSRDSK
jgi:hypothetical protein